MACAARIHWDFDDGSTLTVEEIERMLDVVTVDDVKFFTLSPSSKFLIDVVGPCDAVSSKSHRSGVKYDSTRNSLVNSSFFNEARELRNKASVEHSMSVLSDERRAGIMSGAYKVPKRPRSVLTAARRDPVILPMTLPPVGEEPSIATRVLKMIKKNDLIQIELAAETVSQIIMLIRERGVVEARSVRSPDRPKGIVKISGGKYRGRVGGKWLQGDTIAEVAEKIANGGASAAPVSASPPPSPTGALVGDASVSGPDGSESGSDKEDL
jgi:hypothetical protein